MRSLLNQRGKFVPPPSFAVAIARRRILMTDIRRMEVQVTDPNRAMRYTKASDYDAWRKAATAALCRSQAELEQLINWMEADREGLLRRCYDLMQDLELETADEEYLLADLDAHFRGEVEQGERKTA